MPRWFPRHGLLQGHVRHGRQNTTKGGQPSFPLAHQQDNWSRLWEAVIQYSSRHLYCPAHCRRGTGGGGGVAPSLLSAVTSRPNASTVVTRPRTIPRTTTTGAPAYQFGRPLSTSRRALVSNCVALHEEQMGDPDQPARSAVSSSKQPSVPDPPRNNNTRHHARPIPDPPSPAVPSPPLTSSAAKAAEHQEKQEVLQQLLWKFPEPTHRRPLPIEAWPSTNKALADFYRALDKVQATRPTPTSHRVYMAGHHSHHHHHQHQHQHRSSSCGSPDQHEAALYHAIHLYKILSALQHRHDITLIPTRHVRSLFLAVSRQNKSSAHLDHVLRLASDLIWLRSRQHPPWRMGSNGRGNGGGDDSQDKQEPSRATPKETGDPTATTTITTTTSGLEQKQHISSSGLLVSEYTILMDWIGAFPANHASLRRQDAADSRRENDVSSASTTTIATTTDTVTTTTTSSSSTLSSRDRRTGPTFAAPESGIASNHLTTSKGNDQRHHQHHTKRRTKEEAEKQEPRDVAVDRVWALWQTFQQTGMKADIVLFTTLLNVLAKAEQFDKADQIWDAMMASTASSFVSPALSASSLQKDKVEKSGRGVKRGGGGGGGGGACGELGGSSMQRTSSGSGGGPNLETFSVLLQAYASRNDLDGVAGVYQEIKKQQQQQQQQQQQRFSRHSGHRFSSHDKKDKHETMVARAVLSSTKATAATTSSGAKLQGQPLKDVNTVLLNQILRLLVHVGEHEAAREIFEEMKRSTRPMLPLLGLEKDGRLATAGRGGGGEGFDHDVGENDGALLQRANESRAQAGPTSRAAAVGPDPTIATGMVVARQERPRHQASFGRRAFWRALEMQRSQEWKKRRKAWQLSLAEKQVSEMEEEEKAQQVNPSNGARKPGLALAAKRTGPDAHTVEIMLQLAHKEGDAAFETQLREWLENHQEST